jgi:hypothetical protein
MFLVQTIKKKISYCSTSTERHRREGERVFFMRISAAWICVRCHFLELLVFFLVPENENCWDFD